MKPARRATRSSVRTTAKAKAAAGTSIPSNATAVLYTCNAGVCPTNAQVFQYNLKQLGLNVDIKQFARGVQFQKEGTKGEPFDIAYEGWIADYADPFDFINILLDGRTIHETNNINFSYFNNAATTRRWSCPVTLRQRPLRGLRKAEHRPGEEPGAARRVDGRHPARLLLVARQPQVLRVPARVHVDLGALCQK